MELYSEIMKIIDINLIYCLFPMTLTLIVIKFLFRNRFKTKKVLNIIRWIIISYTIITTIHFFLQQTMNPDEFEFIFHITGPYKIAYILIFICASVFPLSLFNNKLASKSFYLLLIGVLMKIGDHFERFIIIVTSLHRDRNTSSFTVNTLLQEVILMFVLQGVILAILTLIIVEIIERNRKSRNKITL